MRRVLITVTVGVLLLAGCTPTDDPGPGYSPVETGSPAASPAASPAPTSDTTPTLETPVGTPSVVASSEPLQRADPVPIDEPATSAGIVVEIVSMAAITTQAQIPGEIAGPGLAIKVELRNDSDAPIDISSLVVTLYDSTGAPAGEISSGSDLVRGTMAPGERLAGTYQFTIPVENRSPVTIEVSLPERPELLVFEGEAPTA